MIQKFRAWDKNLQRWCPYRIYSLEKLSDDIVEFMYIPQGLWYKNEEVDDNFVLMQSTGLLDLNGNEIFADDIVKMQFRVYDEPELFVVKTKAGHAARVDNRIKGTELWLRHHHCEVVGNRWENPELMEEAE